MQTAGTAYHLHHDRDYGVRGLLTLGSPIHGYAMTTKGRKWSARWTIRLAKMAVALKDSPYKVLFTELAQLHPTGKQSRHLLGHIIVQEGTKLDELPHVWHVLHVQDDTIGFQADCAEIGKYGMGFFRYQEPLERIKNLIANQEEEKHAIDTTCYFEKRGASNGSSSSFSGLPYEHKKMAFMWSPTSILKPSSGNHHTGQVGGIMGGGCATTGVNDQPGCNGDNAASVAYFMAHARLHMVMKRVIDDAFGGSTNTVCTRVTPRARVSQGQPIYQASGEAGEEDHESWWRDHMVKYELHVGTPKKPISEDEMHSEEWKWIDEICNSKRDGFREVEA